MVAVVSNLTRLGGFMGTKQKRYTLVVTDQRLIFAELTKEKVASCPTRRAGAQGRGGTCSHRWEHR